MTLSEAVKKARSSFKQSNIPDYSFEAYLIVCKATEKSRQYIVCHEDEPISKDAENMLNLYISRRLSGEPVQYILGKWDFSDSTFKVGDGVLIPRPETEILVEKADEYLKNKSSAVVFDLCAGTGAVGLSVAKHNPDSKVFLFEKYEKAMEYLRVNAADLGLPNVTIIKCDILNGCPAVLPHPDLVLSNPPYICSDEIPTLQKEVGFEPKSALDGGKDGLDFYRAIYKNWLPLVKKGMLVFECGDGQAKDVIDIFKDVTFSQSIIYDFADIDRAVQIIV